MTLCYGGNFNHKAVSLKMKSVIPMQILLYLLVGSGDIVRKCHDCLSSANTLEIMVKVSKILSALYHVKMLCLCQDG